MASDLREIRLFERAMKQRWDIPQEYKDAAIKRIMRIIADPMSSNREVTSAMRALSAAEAQNQQDEQHAEDDLHQRILSLAERFGVDREDIASITLEGKARGIPGGADVIDGENGT